MHPALAHALEPVLRDIVATSASMPIIDDEEWEGSEETASAYLRDPDGGGTGVYVELGASSVEQVVRATEQVQEWVIEEHWSARSNWPACPTHPASHPMSVEEHAHTAWWRCPRDGSTSFEVGTLPRPPRP